MSITSAAELIAAVARSSILSAEKVDSLTGDLRPRFPDLPSLARYLLEQNWLTAYQVNEVVQGRGQDLIYGPYVLMEWLGKGGLCRVFKAQHQTTRAIVALKVIRSELLSNPEAIRQFLWEMQALSQLNHPNIVRTFEADKRGGVHFFAMEYVEGIDLNKLVQLSGPMPASDACDYVWQTALGLQHAHERGLVHRDIKPANLVLSMVAESSQNNASEGNSHKPAAGSLVKIVDWGLASLGLSSGKPGEAPVLSGEEMIGTADYLSPDQARNPQAVDIRADIYSLGCTFYYLLTGQPPFPGNSLMKKLLQHQQADPGPVESFRADLPPGLPAILKKMMAKKSEDRYQNPRALTLDLLPYCKAEGSPPGTDQAEEIVPADHKGNQVVGLEGKERRNCSRQSCSQEVFYRKLGVVPSLNGPMRLTRIRDVSLGGICLLVNHEVEPGTLLEVELASETEEDSRSLQVKVVHVRGDQGGHWAYGCAFVSEVGMEDLKAFQPKPDVADGSARRAFVRFPWDAEVSCQGLDSPKASQLTGKVVNISAGGLGLLVSRPFETGTLLTIELPHREGTPALKPLVRVARSTKQSTGEWAVGCAFASELSDEDLHNMLQCR